MKTRRQLTAAEKEEKNRKQRERRAQQDPQLKAKRAEENRARAQYVRDQKKRQQNQDNKDNGEAERKRRQRQNESVESRQARLEADAERHRKKRAREEEERQARLREQALHQEALRKEEENENKRKRLQEQEVRQSNLRAAETTEERIERSIAKRVRHHLNITNENREVADDRLDYNREIVGGYRQTENEQETEERKEENRLIMERIRQEREEEEEIIRAMNAFEQSVIIPLETEEEHTFREQTLATRIRAGFPRTHRVACKPIFSEDLVNLHDCGAMNIICEECGARHFKGERPPDKKFTQCCRKGKVILPPPKECPAPLAQLMQNNHPKAKSFMKKIRTYNSAHAFASMEASISSPPGRGPYCFRIHGQVYHNTTPMDVDKINPKYADLYFMDAAQALEFRAHSEVNAGCCRDLMEEIDAMLREKNPYAAVYKMMRQVLEEEYRQTEAENLPHQTVGMIISSDRKNLDQRRYNSPTTNEIAVLFKSSNTKHPARRDIRGHLFIPVGGRRFIQIDTQKPMCDPMTYPLLFPNGEDGWHSNMPYTTTTRRERDEAAAAMDVVEEDVFQWIGEKLPSTTEDQPADEAEEPDSEPEEQFEDEENNPQRFNIESRQKKRVTQCEFYSSLMSILPSSFIGSPRAMNQAYQDAMAICGKYGKLLSS